MNTYDGPTLRAIRENIGIPLRRIARTAGMSHGHLSKVERGEHGRPVTPAIISAYERVTGVKLAEAAAQIADRNERQLGRPGKTWTPGQLTDMRRRGYNAAIAALAVGGHLGEPVGRLLDATGRPVTPAPPDQTDIAQIEQLTDLLTTLDLRHGGGLVSQLGKTLLRWAAPMLDATGMSEPVSRRLHATIGALAHRTGWAAYDTSAHEAARSLFRLGLHTAVRAGDHDLRAHLLADVAAQHNQLGYHQDALDIVRLGEGDERVTPAVRMVLHGVRARTHAVLGDADACRRHVDLADNAFAAASPDQTGWVGRLCHPGRLYAITGQAIAQLAHHSREPADRKDASQRLAQAVDTLDPETHSRARALCATRLALLHLGNGDPDQAAECVRRAVPDAESIHSARLDHDLTALRTALESHPDEGRTHEMAERIG